ncbi:hypothetical protein [Magnetospirillum sulfuroxidans]|uniref:Uncharacterized protein n=1 Tax=Magnetospirillum sulfuroxidans TaxID=611300 RepID=A0ABS5I7R4_9PROT|nr:hypothetical protein [Magnetospirillum sulfuroxidans]MBR9970291.1 hypothetical protein [Magnetospirillum sulfuroxidans]
MFAKFLLTVAMIALIWFGFRFAQRLTQQKQRPVTRERGDKPRFTPDEDGESVRDLIKCPRCDTWRGQSLGSCGRGDCPY